MRRDVIVAGGGPAGICFALHLAAEAPALANSIVVLEKATHPRPKLCGGGLTPSAQQLLARLGFVLDVPSVVVHRPRITFGRAQHTALLRTLIVRRDLFDHALVRLARARGIEVREAEPVVRVLRTSQGVAALTPSGEYHGEVLVAADGSASLVRRSLVPAPDPSHLAKLLGVVAPARPQDAWLFDRQTFLADLSVMEQGVAGCYWEFPCIVDGRNAVNRGIFDNRLFDLLGGRKPSLSLVDAFRRRLEASGVELDRAALEGCPLRCWSEPAAVSTGRVVFVGDAAGADPLFGAGLSFAIGYGAVAARVVARALRARDYGLSDYRAELDRTALFRNLRLRAWVARHVARLPLLRNERAAALLLRLAPLLVPDTPLSAGR